MKRSPSLTIATTLLLCSWTESALAQEQYTPPYPHSTGAQLLPYCEQSDIAVELLRCDLYVQGVADLATTPVRGVRLACIPRGMNRTELVEFAVEHLSSLKPGVLEQSSAASLILRAMQKEFPCPKETQTAAKQAQPAANVSQDPDELKRAFFRKAMEKAAQDKKAVLSGEAGQSGNTDPSNEAGKQ